MNETAKQTKVTMKQERKPGRALSLEELAQVSGGLTSMPPLYYGDATYGDMRLIPKTPLVCG